MKERILQLVLDSFRDQFYPKALDCVKTLREEALKAGESMMFNTFIQETKERLINQRGHEFWLLMVKENVKMITEAEATDSTVTETQAEEFLECGSSKKEEVPVDEDMEDADDLLEMME